MIYEEKKVLLKQLLQKTKFQVQLCLFAIFWMAKLVKFHFPSMGAGISQHISEIDYEPNFGSLTRWVTCLHLKWSISTSDSGWESF